MWATIQTRARGWQSHHHSPAALPPIIAPGKAVSPKELVHNWEDCPRAVEREAFRGRGWRTRESEGSSRAAGEAAGTLCGHPETHVVTSAHTWKVTAECHQPGSATITSLGWGGPGGVWYMPPNFPGEKTCHCQGHERTVKDPWS